MAFDNMIFIQEVQHYEWQTMAVALKIIHNIHCTEYSKHFANWRAIGTLSENQRALDTEQLHI